MDRLMRLTPVLMITGTLAAAGGVAAAEKRVEPTAHPSRPTQSERVVIRFRARETLDGVYRAEAQHRPREHGCDPQPSGPVRAPRNGRLVRLNLSPPRLEGDASAHQW